MNQQTRFDDDDPEAPWMLERKLGGMTPSSRRKSWEASQARARERFNSIAANGFSEARTNGVSLADDELAKDEAPIPSGPPGTTDAKIRARPYVFCDPTKIPRRDRLYAALCPGIARHVTRKGENYGC